MKIQVLNVVEHTVVIIMYVFASNNFIILVSCYSKYEKLYALYVFFIIYVII